MNFQMPIIYEEDVIYLNSKKNKTRTQKKNIEFKIKEKLPEIGMEIQYGNRIYKIFSGDHGPVMKWIDIVYLNKFLGSQFENIFNQYGSHLRDITPKEVKSIFSLDFPKEKESDKEIKEIISSNFDYIQNSLYYLDDFFSWNDELYIPVPHINFYVDQFSVRINFEKNNFIFSENGLYIPIKNIDIIDFLKKDFCKIPSMECSIKNKIENWNKIDINFIKNSILPNFHKIEIIYSYINNRTYNENMLIIHDIYDNCDCDYIFDQTQISIVINAWTNIMELFPKHSTIRIFIEKIIILQKIYLKINQ